MYPSPGSARNVWAPPQQASCNMVADADHPSTTDGTDGNVTAEDDNPEHEHKTIFDIVKSGWEPLLLVVELTFYRTFQKSAC